MTARMRGPEDTTEVFFTKAREATRMFATHVRYLRDEGERPGQMLTTGVLARVLGTCVNDALAALGRAEAAIEAFRQADGDGVAALSLLERHEAVLAVLRELHASGDLPEDARQKVSEVLR